MKQQIKSFANISLPIFALWMLSMCLPGWGVLAQSTLSNDGQSHTISASGSYVDYSVAASSTYPYLYINIKGGDGGDATDESGNGGAGATVSGYLKIGNSDGEIPAGSRLRFIVGQKGGNSRPCAGGGGGTGIAYQASDGSWKIILVAGGGGGNGQKNSGRGGTTSTSGSNGLDANGNHLINAGTDGNDGSTGYTRDSNGDPNTIGKGYKSSINQNGTPLGSAGGKGYVNGGFGFGDGGDGFENVENDDNGKVYVDYVSGGGGGYSGGGAGVAGGGGGSYANSNFVKLSFLQSHGTTSSPSDGYITYRYATQLPEKRIILAADQTKCLDDKGSSTSNGSNIQLWACNGGNAQYWVFDGLNVRLASSMSKCLDLSNSNTTNGNNIQLFDCNNSDAQHWIYDGVYKLIRSKININKCIQVQDNLTSAGANIYIYDCDTGKTGQQWLVDGGTNKPSDTNVVTIRPDYTQTKCLDLTAGNTSNGTNIQLWDCGGTNGKYGNASQQWYFDGLQIKLYKNTSKCLDLSNSNTSNGANIQLYNCNNTNAQHWVYNGVTHELRSTINLDKCIDIVNGGTNNGANFQLYDCAGVGAQHFILSPVPCLDDTTPPVAKCRDITLTGLTAPAATDINNGSTDNCSVAYMNLVYVSGDTYKLVVEDPSGNSSSCTATVRYN